MMIWPLSTPNTISSPAWTSGCETSGGAKQPQARASFGGCARLIRSSASSAEKKVPADSEKALMEGSWGEARGDLLRHVHNVSSRGRSTRGWRVHRGGIEPYCSILLNIDLG